MTHWLRDSSITMHPHPSLRQQQQPWNDQRRHSQTTPFRGPVQSAGDNILYYLQPEKVLLIHIEHDANSGAETFENVAEKASPTLWTEIMGTCSHVTNRSHPAWLDFSTCINVNTGSAFIQRLSSYIPILLAVYCGSRHRHGWMLCPTTGIL